MEAYEPDRAQGEDNMARTARFKRKPLFVEERMLVCPSPVVTEMEEFSRFVQQERGIL
jgi:hypothetical protein